MTENETSFEIGEKNVAVTELDALHYGNPDAAISYDKKIHSGEFRADVAESAVEFIVSGEGMVAINHADDGCIDGRPTEAITSFDDDQENIVESDAVGHERAKVAGGGYVTGAAMVVGAGDRQHTMQAQLAATTSVLHDAGVVAGAHTDSHAGGEASGCGANDKFADILMNGLRHDEAIRANVADFVGILGVAYDDNAMDAVMKNWKATLDTPGFFDASTGQSRLSIVKDTMKSDQAAAVGEKPVSVIKRLAGGHNEGFIIVNFQEDKTFSQNALQTKLHEEYEDVEIAHLPQAFVVDVPRILMLAKALHEQTGDDLTQLIYAGVAYQLATAATLTDGTLRTFIVQ